MLEKSGFKNISFVKVELDFNVTSEFEADKQFEFPFNQFSLKAFTNEQITGGKVFMREQYRKAIEEGRFIGVEGLVVSGNKN